MALVRFTVTSRAAPVRGLLVRVLPLGLVTREREGLLPKPTEAGESIMESAGIWSPREATLEKHPETD